MANHKARGRKKGSTSKTTILDPSLEPFFITKDQYGYTVNENIESKNDETGDLTKRVQTVGFYSNLDIALKNIAEGKLGTSKKTYPSLKSYVDEWRNITNQISLAFKIK